MARAYKVPGEPHSIVAPRMHAALLPGAVGDANADLHDKIVAILMGALVMFLFGL